MPWPRELERVLERVVTDGEAALRPDAEPAASPDPSADLATAADVAAHALLVDGPRSAALTAAATRRVTAG